MYLARKQPKRSERTISFSLLSESVLSRSPRMAWRFGQETLQLLKVLVMGFCLVFTAAKDPRECWEQEYKDQSGSCVACKQCDAGQELSKECGFGFGEYAQCVPCRPGRFKEDGGLQKCKPCLDCTLVNRSQKGNCSTTRNAMCGDCLPGFYRKSKLSGFQDMECVPCGDPPPAYEPHCSSRVNLVPLQSTTSSPRDVALAAVICSALASVLLALLILCVIYCKRQLLEKKPAALARSQDGPYSGAELSCFDRRQVHELPQRACCHCHQSPGHTCRLDQSRDGSPIQSHGGLNGGLSNPLEGIVPLCLGPLVDYPGNSVETWPLMRDIPERLDPLPCDCGPRERDVAKSKEEAETLLGVQTDRDQDHSSPAETLLHLEQPLASSSQA
ncbi:hypothetical protein SKAU_G00088580 [Synaphobranchus kaupii]|uniref:TNFR-Cys domain-containing protein n=1 Tax=Synaphobranchus kaupii TaxID=118154 RepID=A0A9Q1FX32_SYNKA|nr:hypothetical protein SKAU_G00088580 [Synaphobranchus kaupii]